MIEQHYPLFEKYDVDISFSGHIHGYARNELNDVVYIISAGGGGSRSKEGYLDKKNYKNFHLVYNSLKVDIIGEKLRIKTYDNNGQLIDKMKIQH